ncbi:splicing factor U2af large subunit [Achlya hypogyna]|uniref:Splicing factor U2AF subunit n=1 Tax=Achlya hypogyna TaxID=1202772 RepID=A0A1V9YLT1_ACHHY|nr:splicing factor U2af large subunit [Achlya hypogyna]
MAGRGRELVLPAWMLQNQENGGAPPAPPSILPPPGHRDQFADAHEPRRDGYARSDRDRSDRDRDRPSRGGDRGDRYDRDRGGRDARGGRNERDGRDRYDDRRRRDRSRSKDRRREDPRDRRGGKREHVEEKKFEGLGIYSLSGSGRVRTRRFDVLPPGVTQENAAAYAAQAILQANLAALSGVVGPASFGPPTSNAYMHHQAFAGNQHSRHARRLYVGGFGDVPEQEIERFFNEVIDKALGERQEHGSVVSVYINRERHFAFVELKSIELTTACMELDGVSYHGMPLKIRRPNDYNPSAVKDEGPIPKLNVNALGIVSTSVSDGPGKIFIGGLPYHLNEEQVKELLQAFGPLKSFHLVKELNTNLSKGYGFCEYMDPDVTQVACAGLNDMQIGDKTLTVRTALTAGGLYPPDHEHNMQAAPQTSAGVTTTTMMQAATSSNPLLPNVDPILQQLQKHQAMPLQIVPSVPLGAPSRIIVLLNMVTAEDLKDDEEYQDICDDIRAECEKSGPIRSMVVPRPGETQYQTASVGKIFVEFGEVAHAQHASNELHGRGFANRTVAVEFMSQEKFMRREF